MQLREQETTLTERVAALDEELADFRRFVGATSATDVSVAMSEREELREQLTERRERCAALTAELAATRERATELMAEREDEIAVLRERLQRRCVPGRSRTTSSAARLTHVSLSQTTAGDDDDAASEETTPQALDDADRAAATRSEEYWKMRFQEATKALLAAEAALAEARAALDDEQRTHALRDVADAVRREEIEELGASMQRSTVDVEYLKNVLVGFFESGELPLNSTVILVLSRLLQFSEKDKVRLRKGTLKDGTASFLPSSLFSFARQNSMGR